ncbi:MAG: 3-hydroxybutyryl-CoA dehydrogenase [Deltaproteobacteria bacterium]|nr:3-hydroxybutyryl-CoA dehydrogenase [Deltaproteobacteria bacterium]MBI4373857.1 3-hydroxybutyryl-CoA dehydrogenase [Deltaproteobacteria bacterium]
MSEIQTLGVIGSGQMGAGIAQVGAQSGLEVTLVDLKEDFLKKATLVIDKSLAKLAEKGKVQDPKGVKDRIRVSTKVSDLAQCDFIVEAITENEPVKFKTFEELDRVCKPETFLASNTSSISITRLAGKTKRAGRVIGMHFMNPVPMMDLVEIIRGLQTSDETYAVTKSLAERMGKISVLSKDSAGFIVNRILVPMINEAIYALYQGIGTPEDIDQAMKLGTHQPMGPLTLADFVGLDTVLSILEVFHESFGDKFKPCPLLKQYVDAGWLGRKTGRGFYNYSSA